MSMQHHLSRPSRVSLLFCCCPSLPSLWQFEEMYEQKRREVNKAYEKYEKQLKAAKTSGKNAKANAEKVGSDLRVVSAVAGTVHTGTVHEAQQGRMVGFLPRVVALAAFAAKAAKVLQVMAGA